MVLSTMMDLLRAQWPDIFMRIVVPFAKSKLGIVLVRIETLGRLVGLHLWAMVSKEHA